MTTLRPELIDELLADYETPEDLLGEEGLFKQPSCCSWRSETPACAGSGPLPGPPRRGGDRLGTVLKRK